MPAPTSLYCYYLLLFGRLLLQTHRQVAATEDAAAAAAAPVTGCQVRLSRPVGVRPLHFAARQLQEALAVAAPECSVTTTAEQSPRGNLAKSAPSKSPVPTIRLLVSPGHAGVRALNGSEGFHLLHRGGGSVDIIASAGAGAMYGALDLAEHITAAITLTRPRGVALLVAAGTAAHGKRVEGARFGYRAVKVNLPWSPYRSGPATTVQMAGCRNLSFWSALLDHLARSRFNVLSIWSEHPWPYMIRPHNFPRATLFNDTELELWKSLHSGIFKLARDRAIKPVLVGWNVFVGRGFQQYYDPGAHADSDGPGGVATVTPLANQYNREAITQTLLEYPDLGGIGLSLDDRVQNLNLSTQLSWARDVVIAGVKAAQSSRSDTAPVIVIYRAPFGEGKGQHGDPAPAVARKSIENLGLDRGSLFVQIKFNWSHGHSLTKLVQVHGGGVGQAYYQPPPDRYKVTWMVRNEDFFFLRWGGAGFIRAHIAANGHAFVGGYAVGSEGMIPSVEYAERPQSQTWTWMFERQWLFYTVWGRLLFDPATPDSTFASSFDLRYPSTAGSGAGALLLQGFELVSIVPLRICAFVTNTWDFTLHAEGFLMPVNNPDKHANGFISVETLLKSRTLDPSMQAIADFVSAGANASLTSPLRLADELTNASLAALAMTRNPVLAAPKALVREVGDLISWAHLGLYFACKLQGTVAFARFRANGDASWQAAATKHLTDARTEWKALVNATAHLRSDIPLDDFAKSGKTFSWAALLPMVERDLALVSNGGMCGLAEHQLCPGLKGKGAACQACVHANKHALGDAGCWDHKAGGTEKSFAQKWCGQKRENGVEGYEPASREVKASILVRS